MKANALKVGIIAIALVLPGIVVADVLITGQALMTGTQNDAQFYFTKGPNYATASGSGYIHFEPNPTSATHKLAEIDFQGAGNQSIFAINMLEVNFASGVSGTFYLNFTGVTAFPAGCTVYLSSYAVTYDDFDGVGSATVAPTTIGPAVLTSVELNIPSGTTVSTSWTVTGSSAIYISFYFPAGEALGISNAETIVQGTLTA